MGLDQGQAPSGVSNGNESHWLEVHGPVCVTSPHPETDPPEAKQLRLCFFVQKWVEVLRQKSKSKLKLNAKLIPSLACRRQKTTKRSSQADWWEKYGLVEGSPVSTPERATRAWPIKGVKDLPCHQSKIRNSCILISIVGLFLASSKFFHETTKLAAPTTTNTTHVKSSQFITPQGP